MNERLLPNSEPLEPIRILAVHTSVEFCSRLIEACADLNEKVEGCHFDLLSAKGLASFRVREINLATPGSYVAVLLGFSDADPVPDGVRHWLRNWSEERRRLKAESLLACLAGFTLSRDRDQLLEWQELAEETCQDPLMEMIWKDLPAVAQPAGVGTTMLGSGRGQAIRGQGLTARTRSRFTQTLSAPHPAAVAEKSLPK